MHFGMSLKLPVISCININLDGTEKAQLKKAIRLKWRNEFKIRINGELSSIISFQLKASSFSPTLITNSHCDGHKFE